MGFKQKILAVILGTLLILLILLGVYWAVRASLSLVDLHPIPWIGS